MKIMIAGGAGFIGLNFIKYLINNDSDSDIICFDKMTYAANKNEITALSDRGEISLFKGDIANTEDVENVFSKYEPDILVNFAAETHVDRSFLAPDLFCRTNITGTVILLEASVKYHVKRFHQISTDEVYGPNTDGKIFDENSKLSPTSPYSASKAAAEMMVLSYFKSHGLNATIERSSNNYGEYQYPEKLIPLVISRAINDEKIPVYGNGCNRRSWLYVNDHCEATARILKYGKTGEIYNITSRNNVSNLELIQKILKIMNKKDDLIQFIQDRPSHDISYEASSEKIKKDLLWSEKVDLDSGLEKTVNWYTKNIPMLNNIINSKEYREYFKDVYKL